MNKNQKGFAALEGLLILIIIAIIGGTGYYVWHSKSQTDKTLDDTSNSSQGATVKRTSSSSSSTNSASQKYLIVKEWGVRIPYKSSDTYTYKVGNSGLIDIISANLANKYGCKDFGAGELIRDAPNDPFGPSSDAPTAKQTEDQSPGTFKIVNGYYYYLVHDQASCSDTVTLEAQNQANNAVTALVPDLEATPQ